MTKGKAYKAFMKRVSESINEVLLQDRIEAICINPMTMADLVDESVFAFMSDAPPIRTYRRKPIRYMSEIPQGEFVVASRPMTRWWTDPGLFVSPAVPSGSIYIYPAHGTTASPTVASFTNSKTWTINNGPITSVTVHLDET